MSVRGLTIIVAEASTARFRSALTLALAQAALGGAARLFLDGRAVALTRLPIEALDDHAYAAAGLPRLGQLLDEALEAGIGIILCQSGLLLTGSEPADHDPRCDFGGLIGVLAAAGEDRLLMA
ncbi:peroxiredoxin [Flavisphingomonas formosensis]|uniref:peroxiredoxin n=1 Tax=Flavisphingomonas formosensis TaxID=861534 RepID=UPI001E5E6392|nr:peroxiredoxin [Sphingomonas formosensis]